MGVAGIWRAVAAAAIAGASVAVIPLAHADEPNGSTAPKQAGTDPRHAQRFEAALALLREGRTERAARDLKALADELFAGMETGNERVRYFCGRNNAEETAWLFGAFLTKVDRLVIMDSLPCDARYWQAYALVEAKRLGEARAVLEALVPLAPTRSQYQAELGHLLSIGGEPSRGLALYQDVERNARFEAPEVQPTWRAKALRGQGYALVELGRWDEAEAAYVRSLEFEPDSRLARGELEFIRARKRELATKPV